MRVGMIGVGFVGLVTGVLTKWVDIRSLDWAVLGTTMARPLLIVLRNFYSLGQAEGMGVDYISLGRNPVGPGAAEAEV